MTRNTIRKPTASPGFNGAAIFQSRKWQRAGGNLLAQAQLQWSRDLSIAEMAGEDGAVELLEVASMEPRSFNRGNVGGLDQSVGGTSSFNGAAIFQSRKLPLDGPKVTPLSTLQWSRDLSIAEMITPERAFSRSRAASMEPRSFNRGNGFLLKRNGTRHKSFNGAAIFQSRKSGR